MNHSVVRSPALGSSLFNAFNRQAYICARCRSNVIKQAQRAPISTSISRNAEKLPYAERFRRKIWGTDTPPGQADPYTKEPNQTKETEEMGRDAEGLSATEEAVALQDSASTVDPQLDYVPAQTWDGLEHVGGTTGWWEEAWDEEHQFTGFMAPEKLESRSDLEDAIRRALVEVYTLVKANLPPTKAVDAQDDKIIPDFSKVTFGVRGKRVDLFYASEQVRQDILDSFSRPGKQVNEVLEVQAESETSEATGTTDLQSVQAIPVQELSEGEDIEAKDLSEGGALPTDRDESWMAVPLGKSVIKFAILKRVMQLTGKRIPDPAIPDLKHGKALLTHLVTKPKPKKLAESLLNKDDLISLPNVKVLDRRFTPIDKEKEVGRWKVIEQELQRRGLPVTGNL